jgi:putative SOS response-associated peptidase YedK
MCGRFAFYSPHEAVVRLFGVADFAPDIEPRWNIAPTTYIPTVRVLPDDPARRLAMLYWGLVPAWAKDRAIGAKLNNARSETLREKPSFRNAYKRRRCLVLADGFYEWKKLGKKKQPMFIHPGNHRFFAFAGLWSRAKTESGELHSFTIITGPPNDLVAPIHDRMPVVLDRSAWSAWLDPALDAEGARALLTVPPVEDWRAEPVSSWVNVADHDDPKCIEPTPPQTTTQGSLWD